MQWSVIITIPLVSVILLIWYERRRLKKEKLQKKYKIITDYEEECANLLLPIELLRQAEKNQEEEESEPYTNSGTFHLTHRGTAQCIFLLSTFTVIDKNGEDITSSLTPTLKELLLLLIIFTAKHRGITGNQITEILWKGKNKYAARNNRNVSLSKLRSFLHQVGDVDIRNEEDRWIILFGEDTLCDFSEIAGYYQAIREKTFDHSLHLPVMIKLLSRGLLLHHTHYPWLDHYKANFGSKTVDVLTDLLNHPNITNFKLRLSLTQAILEHDCLNEFALHIQCSLLHKLGRKDDLQLFYDSFCTTYHNLLGIPFTMPLNELIKKR